MEYSMIGKFVIVRATDAGVHVGYLEDREANVVRLSKSRRIYAWKGAYTLSEIAVNGVGQGSNIAAEVNQIYVRNWCEIIECSEAAEKNLRSATWDT